MKRTVLFPALVLIIALSGLVLRTGPGGVALTAGMMGGGMMQGMRQMMGGGGSWEADPSGRPPEDKEILTLGRRVYMRRCAACHGRNGDGRGERAHMLVTKPRDFTIGVFKFRSTPSGSIPTDYDIYRTITSGIRGTGMPPWGDLSSRERWAVTYYIKTFSERFSEEEADPAVKVPGTPRASTGLIKRGREVYDEAKCWKCHGREGRGDGPKAEELEDDWGHRIRPRDFTSEPLKRDGLEGIFLTVSTGLDGTPMASHADALSEEDRLAVASYVRAIARPSWMIPVTRDERAGMMIKMHTAMMGGMAGMMCSE